jgi:hypothetical protein
MPASSMSTHSTELSESSVRQEWNLFGHVLPKSEIVFFCQIIVIYFVIITCIINLSRGQGDSNLWTALLSSNIGYLLPSPTIKRKK